MTSINTNFAKRTFVNPHGRFEHILWKIWTHIGTYKKTFEGLIPGLSGINS